MHAYVLVCETCNFPVIGEFFGDLARFLISPMSSLFEKLGRDMVKLLPNFHLKIVEVPTQEDGQTTPTEFRIACINLEYV
jgi:hypothetical protein